MQGIFCTLHVTGIKNEDSPYQNTKPRTMRISDKQEAQHCTKLFFPIESAGCQWTSLLAVQLITITVVRRWLGSLLLNQEMCQHGTRPPEQPFLPQRHGQLAHFVRAAILIGSCSLPPMSFRQPARADRFLRVIIHRSGTVSCRVPIRPKPSIQPF